MGDTRNDPTMEDILASIKRIIAEDGAAVSGPRAKPAARSAPADPEPAPLPANDDPDDGVLELTETVDEPAELLVSTDVASASRQSLAALSAVVKPAPEPANALEGLVQEMLRPMLKDWLDARLPALVEDLVAREIARITGKRG